MLALTLLVLWVGPSFSGAAAADAVAEARALARIGMSLQAIEILETATRTTPSPQAFAFLSQLQASTNRIPQAARSLSRALDLAPGQHRWRMTLGTLYVQLGRLPEARRELERVVNEWPEAGLAYYFLAAVLKSNGELQQAELVAERAVTLLPLSSARFRLDQLDHPAPVNALFQLAEIRQMQGKDSEPLLRQVVEIEPFHAPARYLLARRLLNQGHREQAQYELAIFENIKVTEGLYRNALLLLVNWGDEDRALESLREAVENSPEHPAALFLLGRELLRRGRDEEASPYLERCAALRPSAAAEEARRLASSGDLDTAIEILETATRSYLSAPAYSHLSELQARVGRIPQAARSLTKALELDPGQSRWRATLGSLYYQLGRLEEARVELQQVVEEWPEADLAHYYLAGVLKATRELEQAERLAERAVELLPVSAAQWSLEQLNHPAPLNALFLLAEIRQNQGDDSEELLRQVLAIEPLHSPALYLLARLSLERGERDQAKEQMERVRRIKRAEERYRAAISYLFNMGNDKLALQEMRGAVEACPEHPAALFLLGRQLLRLGQTEEASKCFEACARLRPQNASEVQPFMVLISELRKTTR